MCKTRTSCLVGLGRRSWRSCITTSAKIQLHWCPGINPLPTFVCSRRVETERSKPSNWLPSSVVARVARLHFNSLEGSWPTRVDTNFRALFRLLCAANYLTRDDQIAEHNTDSQKRKQPRMRQQTIRMDFQVTTGHGDSTRDSMSVSWFRRTPSSKSPAGCVVWPLYGWNAVFSHLQQNPIAVAVRLIQCNRTHADLNLERMSWLSSRG